MSIFENFEAKLRAESKYIVFTEGSDARILSAASRLLAGKTLRVILLGEQEAVNKAAAEGGFDITGAEILDPASYEGFDEMVAKMVELRFPSPTISAPCLLRWARRIACWVAPLTLPLIRFAPHCS